MHEGVLDPAHGPVKKAYRIRFADPNGVLCECTWITAPWSPEELPDALHRSMLGHRAIAIFCDNRWLDV